MLYNLIASVNNCVGEGNLKFFLLFYFSQVSFLSVLWYARYQVIYSLSLNSES